MTQVKMTVNGKAASGDVEGRTLLSQFLRDDLGLTGTHVGCDTSQCGACVVHVNGEAVKSCTMLAVEAKAQRWPPSRGKPTRMDRLMPFNRRFRITTACNAGFARPAW